MLFIKQKQKGLTLIEMIIALIILGLLVVRITPQLQVYYAQNRLRAAAEGLYDDVLNARMTTIKTAATTTITFVTGASWCYGISSAAIACACGSAASASNCNLGIISSTDYPNTTLATTISGSSTTFDAVRATPNNTGTVTFSTTTGGTQSIMLTLSALGTTTLCSGTGGNADVGGYAGCP